MAELFVLFRHDTQQWYHSFCPRGAVLWVDKQEHSQYLLEEEAENIKSFLNYSPYKNVLEVLPV
jgi:hypothetical protein